MSIVNNTVEKIVNFAEHINDKVFRPYQKKRAIEIIRSVILNEGSTLTSLWARRCLHKDSLIYLADGRCVEISKIKRGDIVLSINQDNKLELDEVENVWKTNNKKEIFKIKSGYGFVAYTSGKHLFLTPQGWREAEKLATNMSKAYGKNRAKNFSLKGIYLRSESLYPRNQGCAGVISKGIFGKRSIGKNRSAFLGYLIADGSYAKGQSVKFTNTNTRMLKEVEILSLEFGTIPKYYKKGNGFDIVFSSESKASELSPNKLINWLREIGIHGQTNFEKIIPDIVFQLKEEELSLFINRMFSADGYAYTRLHGQGRKPGHCIGCCASSYLFALQLQSLLFKFGIQSFIKKDRNIFRVEIFSIESVNIFIAKIGLIFGKENQTKNVQKVIGKFNKKFKMRYNFGSDVDWPTITEHRKTEEQEILWDIRTKKNHNFIANGFVVHNSGKSEMLKAVTLSLMSLLPELSKTALVKDLPALKIFSDGFIVAIAGPKIDTARVPFTRIRRQARTTRFIGILDSLGLETVSSNSQLFELSNGSYANAFSGSETANNEGQGAQLLLLDESQLLSPFSVYKILRPMIADNNGTISETGTSSRKRCPFLTDIEYNRRNKPYLHQEVPYTEVIKYSKEYAKFIEDEIRRLPGGLDNQFFRMNYLLEWMVDQTKFISDEKKFLRCGTVNRGEYYAEGLYGGIDWGKKISATIGSIIENRNDHLAIIDLIELKGDYEDQIIDLSNFFSRYPMRKIYAESVGSGDPLADRIRKKMGKRGEEWIVEPKYMSQQYKDLIFTNLQIELSASKPRLFYFDDNSPESKNFIRQFLDAEQEFRGKLLVVKKPDEEGATDDYLFSVALCSDAALTSKSGNAGNFSYRSSGNVRPVYSDMGDF